MIDRRVWLASSLGVLLASAPLLFGATSRMAYLSLAMGASALALAVLACGARPSGPGWIPMALLLALGLFQIVPIPSSLLRRLSPLASAYSAQAWEASGRSQDAQGWHPISLHPHATLMSLVLLGSAACVFAAVRFTASHPRARCVLVGALLVSGMFQASYGIAAHVDGSQEILGWPKLHYTDSATGTFVNRNHFAGYLEMTLMLCLGVLLALIGPEVSWRRARVEVSTPRVAAILLMGTLACVMAAALIFSHSRAGVASAAAGLCILLGWSWRGSSRRLALIVVGGIVGCGMIYASVFDPASLTDRLERTIQDLEAPGGRVPLWRDSARMATSFLPLGAGLGTFEHLFPALRTIDSAQLYRHAHNDYLELAVELGAPGLLLGLLLLALFLRRAMARPSSSMREAADQDRLARGAAMGGVAGVGAIALHSFFDFNLHVPANLLTLAAVCALALPSAGIAALQPTSRAFL